MLRLAPCVRPCRHGLLLGSRLAHRRGLPAAVCRAHGFGEDAQQRRAQSGASGGNSNRKASLSDALTKSLADVSERAGRVAKTKNIVLGSDTSEETWRALDERVNTYPTKRSFKAIGVGGEGFAASMRSAVEGVLGHVHEGDVSLRPSSAGKYVSVTVGPVLVENGDQVRSIYAAMREDERLKFFI